jgi:repressor LexA
MPAATDIAEARRRRAQVLTLIAKSINSKGYPPSVSELANATGVSTLTTRRDLASLEDAGKIERDPGVGRGIRLL